jgi:hypothetical protein
MIVIFEQHYDLVSIHDIIKDEQIFNYVEYYKQRLLDEKDINKIVNEKVDKSYGGHSYSFKVQYNHDGKPESWVGFDTVRFEKFNNFKKWKKKK